MTMTEKLDEMREKKAYRTAEIKDNLEKWCAVLEHAEAAMEKLGDVPEDADDYASAAAKAEVARKKIASLEKTLTAIAQGRYDFVSQQELAEYHKMKKVDALKKLRDLANTQIHLYESMWDAQRKAYQVRQAAIGSMAISQNEFLPSQRGIDTPEMFEIAHIATALDGHSREEALAQAVWGLPDGGNGRRLSLLKSALEEIESELERCE